MNKQMHRVLERLLPFEQRIEKGMRGRVGPRRGLSALMVGVLSLIVLCNDLAADLGGDRTILGGALAGERPRVLVSTDIGGTDPDDFQSLVHLLVYADVIDIEGLVSSPYGEGRTKDILSVIDCYDRDYDNLSTYSNHYPRPDALRSITKQGEVERAPYAGIRQATQGSQWIVECARRKDPRPLHVLVWGGIEDVAQALHDAPDILPKIRVYYIGGPNKKWGPDVNQYLVEHHPTLWIIEANATYRGWFVGGDQSGEWGNRAFVEKHVRGRGALGEFFVQQKADIKMGDTPSVGWILNGRSEDPTQPGWGGQFVRAWKRPYLRLNRMPTSQDAMEVFGVLELAIPLKGIEGHQANGFLIVENQRLPGHVEDDDTMRFRFTPKAAKRYRFKIESDVGSLDGKSGAISVMLPAVERKHDPDPSLPNWWTDDPSPERADDGHHGAKSVNRWRQEYLSDFAGRMLRCQFPAPTEESR